MKTGILSVPSGFGECFPSQNKFLSTKRPLEMVTPLITMFYSVICEIRAKWQKKRKKTQSRLSYFNFLVPVLSSIKKKYGICQKNEQKSREYDRSSMSQHWLIFKGKEL